MQIDEFPALTSDVTLARDQFTERVMSSAAGAFNIFTAYIGDRLGLYTALAQYGPLTSRELAEHTNTAERYIREWLEQQTVAGFITVDNPEAGPLDREYRIPAGHAEVLTDTESLNYLAPLFQMIAAVVTPLPQVIDAFRTGAGVPYTAYTGMHEGQGRMNRAMCLQQLGPEWLASIPEVHTKLTTGEAPRIADVGCGHGWSSIGMARTYPKAEVHGFDLDNDSIEAAIKHADAEGLQNQVRFWVRDAADLEFSGRYDLVIALECLHDMPDPVNALRTIRRLANETGTVIVIDERVGHTVGLRTGMDDVWMERAPLPSHRHV